MLSRPQVIPLLSLTGVVLDALGGLYLAYDLLGGKRGPLRLLSRVLTYSAIFGLGYGAILGLWFGLAGALVSGPSIEYQLFRRAQGIEPSRVEWVLIYRAYERPQLNRRLLMPGIVRGLTIGLAGVVSGALTGRPEALLYGIQIGAVVGTLNTTVTILSPSVEWWADNLRDRALGGYGAVLVLIGSALQTVQYVMPLISRYR